MRVARDAARLGGGAETSRVRSINPGFFLDDELADCQPLARILFAGLWCIADREGRLKDNPRRIKPETLPYDDVDITMLLEELSTGGFIYRYADSGARYIAIPSWNKYQNPHYREAKSTIPAPSCQRWTELESTLGQCWVNVERSSSSSSSHSNDASRKDKYCPEDGATIQSDGHCPVCQRVVA